MHVDGKDSGLSFGGRREYYSTWPTERDLPATHPIITLEKKNVKRDRGREEERALAAAKKFKRPPAEGGILHRRHRCVITATHNRGRPRTHSRS